VLATALHQALLTGLHSPPLAWDPAFGQFDRQLLATLGFAAPEEAPDLALPNGVGAALFYMPCCPRELYGELLVSDDACRACVCMGVGGLPDAPRALVKPTRWRVLHRPAQAANLDRLQLLTILGTSMRSHTDTAPLVAALTGAAAGDSQGSSGVVPLVHQQGRVCEAIAPDCAAHGVGVAVHMFRRLPAPVRPS
jgi:hypothetical protein